MTERAEPLTEFEQLDDSALFDRALQEADDDLYWELVAELHRRGTPQICDRAMQLASSTDASKREIAADVLGQLGFNDNYPCRDASTPILLELAATDTEWFVVESAVAALGHLADGRALIAVAGLVDHPRPEVRLSVAHALPSMLGIDPVSPDSPGVTTLLKLTSDDDSDVRDWATFGVGSQVVVDSHEIRDALIARLADTDADTRFEALVGLARRRDPRALQPTMLALESEDDWVGGIRSAELLRWRELGPAIEGARRWGGDPINFALAERRCDPARQAEEVQMIEELVVLGGARLGTRLSVSSDLLPFDHGEVQVTVESESGSLTYDFDRLMDRAGGSPGRAVELIESDVARR